MVEKMILNVLNEIRKSNDERSMKPLGDERIQSLIDFRKKVKDQYLISYYNALKEKTSKDFRFL